jgi:hypothetical protein
MSPRAPLRVVVNPLLEGPRILRELLIDLAREIAVMPGVGPSGQNDIEHYAYYLARTSRVADQDAAAEVVQMYAAQLARALQREDKTKLKKQRRAERLAGKSPGGSAA